MFIFPHEISLKHLMLFTFFFKHHDRDISAVSPFTVTICAY